MKNKSDSYGLYFEIYLDSEKKYRWRLCQETSALSIGYFIIATSHQGYNEKSLCEYDIRYVKLASNYTPIDDKTI